MAKPYLAPQPSRGNDQVLRVFISSKMRELFDVRAMIEESLRAINMEPFVYERTCGSRKESAYETCQEEVDKSDIYVGVFSEQYGEATAEEFYRARHLGIPCLVYIRSGVQREQKLEEFLGQHVYPLKEGLTYSYFVTCIELGKLLSKDIMRLLVGAYRCSTRKIPIQGIQPVIRLAWDVADWYKALGCELVAEPGQVDERTMDLSIRFTQSMAGFATTSQDIFIRCQHGRIGIPEVRKFEKIFKCSRAARAQMITDLTFSPEAAKYFSNRDTYSLLTLDKLLDETIRFDEYLDQLEQEIHARKIDTLYIPMECRRHIGELNLHEIDKEHWALEEGGIDRYVDYWLQDASKEHLSVLGGFGSGKTWFVYHLAWLCLQEYREAKLKRRLLPRIPLVIPLLDFARAVTIESLFSEFFFRKHNIGLPNYEAFQQLNRMGKLLLLFDGFDEMSARVDRQRMIDNFWELARVLVPGAKAILTCRTEHFPDARAGRVLLGAKLRDSVGTSSANAPQFEVVELEMFNERQIQQLLKKRHVPKGIIDSILSKPDLMDLARRPLLAVYILDAQPEVQAGASVDVSRIYLYAIRRKMKDDISQERTFSSMADKLYFLCEISWEMLSRDASGLNYREFPTRLRNLFGESIQSPKDLDHWRYDMMGQTMLIRNDDGDYSMAHRSLAEFFTAYKFVAELGVLAADFFELAQQQSDIDQKMMPKQYTWSTYFKRQLRADGTAEPKAPAKEFMTEDATVSGTARDMVDIERLSPNAIVFASYMISKNPTALAKLCNIAWQQTGLLARNALYLIPYLRTVHAVALARLLVNSCKEGPLRNGVCWLLGELGVKSEEVKSALKRTVQQFAAGKHTNSHAWWESGFALEKLGEFGDEVAPKGARPMEFLGRNLPADADLHNSLENIRKAVVATTPEEAVLNQADIVVIIKNRNRIDVADLYHSLKQLDFSRDCMDRRVYYSVWLCGHLAIEQSVSNIVKATTHPQGSVRNTACEALGKAGIIDPLVISALERCLSDSYYRARFHAAEALASLKAQQSLPSLQRQIRLEEVREVREEMIRSQDLLR
ncbi:MAG: DUF4062 domain-containing protein [Proteobacteria bacterium]|nr:DUF4062 domain-containing protein [Pseudomonadota bacterium]MBU4294680.1 DUF4062 domain-containing protein [Pseudomonadota bacterium]MCG2748592.1 HEAT repeat domain-containing protein [Desulfobulbaceae bacterium]